MQKVTQKEIKEAIENCRWREKYMDICKGMCLPCRRTIERGECDTLIELYRGKEVKH